MKVLPALLLLSVITVLSCDSGLESEGDENPLESSYVMALSSNNNSVNEGIFAGVETEWNLSSGIVVLGPEEEVLEPGESGGPLARLELHLVRNPSDSTSAVISSATLATSNVRVGTSEELDSRLYTGGAGDGEVPECDGDLCELCGIRSISSAHITTDGPCLFEMELVGGEGPETIRVNVGFTATDAE